MQYVGVWGGVTVGTWLLSHTIWIGLRNAYSTWRSWTESNLGGNLPTRVALWLVGLLAMKECSGIKLWNYSCCTGLPWASECLIQAKKVTSGFCLKTRRNIFWGLTAILRPPRPNIFWHHNLKSLGKSHKDGSFSTTRVIVIKLLQSIPFEGIGATCPAPVLEVFMLLVHPLHIFQWVWWRFLKLRVLLLYFPGLNKCHTN